ncbi:hypothetical protein V1227_01780 [Lentzea sp. DG1S-22]|nr:hypothetical protein [Lentzea sp. DG1S-22]WVH81511.1 hypothetical protein V1227_01780 [Lentzea sp. DG1S-22]
MAPTAAGGCTRLCATAETRELVRQWLTLKDFLAAHRDEIVLG